MMRFFTAAASQAIGTSYIVARDSLCSSRQPLLTPKKAQNRSKLLSCVFCNVTWFDGVAVVRRKVPLYILHLQPRNRSLAKNTELLGSSDTFVHVPMLLPRTKSQDYRQSTDKLSES